MKATIQVGPIGVKYKNRYSLAFYTQSLGIVSKESIQHGQHTHRHTRNRCDTSTAGCGSPILEAL